MSAPEEFTWLFAREYRSIVGSVDVVLHDLARSEEITQDAFVRLLEHWNKVSRYERPGAWVRRVAIRMAVKFARREQRRAVLERSTSNSDRLEGVDLDLEAAIHQLPPRQRAVIALHYLEDLPVHEVADIMGCSPSTASVHLHRGRKRLSELLSEEVEQHVD